VLVILHRFWKSDFVNSYFSENADWNWLFRMLAFSTGFECNNPPFCSGGISFPSDLLCFINVQKRFIQLGCLSSLGSGVMISSMYFQYARLISLCTSLFNSLYFCYAWDLLISLFFCKVCPFSG
jgi:hypothetical protein